MSPKKEQSIVMFDGECGLCSRLVQFIMQRDSNVRFRFTPLQSASAQVIWRHYYKGADDLQAAESGSFALVHNGRLYFKSDAALQLVKRMEGLWPLLAGLVIVPWFIRDRVYDWVAKRRRQWQLSSSCQWSPELAKAYQERLVNEKDAWYWVEQTGR
ncbi:thiol-disulfide oxidoreductase DCC family protein [Paenibacillus senegalensis]|uniref:thiol-disulfide oxidoreductase DCC family protein n=1 Tax=Paenibacillus senegalensis TaxID=1465766 RepID=UPI00028957A4|nr:DCC1-like thiol-disulfide oxidoreductase family protein [Paenibacillus senegalensis]